MSLEFTTLYSLLFLFFCFSSFATHRSTIFVCLWPTLSNTCTADWHANVTWPNPASFFDTNETGNCTKSREWLAQSTGAEFWLEWASLHPEGWMISDQKIVLCRVPVHYLTMVVNSVAFPFYLLNNRQAGY
jgi:hypothetical protein